MQQHPYYLHSILVHEGTGEGGHYYSFIFDRSAHKWYRFNDYKVSEETEDRVFEESFGDLKLQSCAIGLFYVNHSIYEA
jgi:ubiquitin C-terminal hydrolase